MCIAILTTAGKELDRKTFARCWDSNRHGVGFAYCDGSGDVQIDKGWMNEVAAWNRYQQLLGMNRGEKPMLIHFRAATVGGVDADNCHPFKVKGGAMIHNGTFWRDGAAKKSDSRMLAEMMHNQLTYSNLTKNKEQFDFAFGYNRVAFLFKGGKYVIFSEKFNMKTFQYGQWKDGIWYSNGGWKGGYGSNYGDDAAEASSWDNWTGRRFGGRDV